MTDEIMNVLYSSLNGLMTQQRVIADNISNVSTPGYQAKSVDFETALRDAVSQGTSPAADPSVVSYTGDPSKQDGNNVNLDAETVAATQNTLQYQAVTEAVNARFQLLRTAMGA